MMDPITLMQPELAFEESVEKIFNLIEEKKYFQVRDEMLKYNEADIAEMRCKENYYLSLRELV